MLVAEGILFSGCSCVRASVRVWSRTKSSWT